MATQTATEDSGTHGIIKDIHEDASSVYRATPYDDDAKNVFTSVEKRESQALEQYCLIEIAEARRTNQALDAVIEALRDASGLGPRPTI